MQNPNQQNPQLNICTCQVTALGHPSGFGLSAGSCRRSQVGDRPRALPCTGSDWPKLLATFTQTCSGSPPTRPRLGRGSDPRGRPPLLWSPAGFQLVLPAPRVSYRPENAW